VRRVFIIVGRDRIYSIALTYLAPEDDIRRDLCKMIRTLEFRK